MINYELYDIVLMKKDHPCHKGDKKFQIVRLGADIKIRCLGCGNYIMLPREKFDKSIKQVLEHQEKPIN